MSREIAVVSANGRIARLMKDPRERGSFMSEEPPNIDTMYWVRLEDARRSTKRERVYSAREVVEWLQGAGPSQQFADNLRGQEVEFAELLCKLAGRGAVVGSAHAKFEHAESSFGVPEKELHPRLEGSVIVFWAILSTPDDLIGQITKYAGSLEDGSLQPLSLEG